MTVFGSVPTSESLLGRWAPRLAAFVLGVALGALLSHLVVNVIWPGVIPGFEARPLTTGAPARMTTLLALLFGVSASTFVSAYQASHDAR